MPYCPDCHAEIDHLKYSADYTAYGHEYGTCSTDGSDWDQDDREESETCNDGDCTYSCPECNNDIDPDDVLDEDPDDDCGDEEEIEGSTPNTELTDGGTNIVRPGGRASSEVQPLTKYQECPKCKTLNFLDGDSSIFCSNCNEEIINN